MSAHARPLPVGAPAYAQDCVESIRQSIRECQLRLLAEPDPTSPWWFLVDPTVESPLARTG